ncbi:MAG: hypothetical protein HFF01_02875 [Erysipelotrichaceae bacterium]|nr:hypothetical protein [Erysipelotrichaceae bacterium]
MAYVPPKDTGKKKKIRYVLAVLFLCVLSIGVYFIIQSLTGEKKSEISICGFNKHQSEQLLKESYTETYEVSDYLFYGESLNLFQNPHDLEKMDPISRKTVELINLCSDETFTYTMESYVDRKIDVGELPSGLYSIYLNDQVVKKRLTYQEAIRSEPFYSVARNGKQKVITLIADKQLSEETLKDNTLFIKIEDVEIQEESVDVFLDPYGPRLVNGFAQPVGSANGMNEAEEMQKAAEKIKAYLESYGLRVAIAKEEALEPLSYYGFDGIMDRAYQSGAKYYIELGMNASSQSTVRGFEIYHSDQASGSLSNSIGYALSKNTPLQASNAYTWKSHSEGVASCPLIGSAGKEIYDSFPAIRESGGRATGAAQMNADAKTNASFVAEGNTGMYAISVNFIYLSNADDVALWKQKQDDILKQFSEAFVKAIHGKK